MQRAASVVTAGAAALGRLRPTITVSGDSGPFQRAAPVATSAAAALGRLRLTITVGGNTSPAIRGFGIVTAAATALGRLRPTITVNANTAGALAQLTAFRAAAGTIIDGVGSQVSRLASLFSGAGPLALYGGILLAVSVLTGPLLSAATIAASAAGGVAAGLGLVAGTAYTLANSSSPAVVAAFGQLKGSFDQLKQDMFHAFEPASLELAGLGQTAIGVAQNQMPLLGSAAQSTVAAMRSSFQPAIDQVGSSSSNSLSTILSYVPGLMGNMTTAATNFGAGFLSIMAQAMPQANSFMQWISDTAQSFFQWTQSAEGRQQIQRFLDAATPVEKQLWQAFTDIVPKLIDISIDYGPTVAKTIQDIAWFVDLLLDGVKAIQQPLDWFVNTLGDLQTALDSTSVKSGDTASQVRSNWSKLGDDLGLQGPL